MDASELHDTTDVGRLTSPSFSQEREVSAIPLSVSGSQTHLSVARPMRDVDPFSSTGKPVREVEPCSRFEKPLSKCKRKSITGECANFFNAKGKNSVRTEIFVTSLNRKLNKLFKENSQLRQDYLKRRLNRKRIGKAKC